VSIANADVEKMERFLSHLSRFDKLLEDEFRGMLGDWRDLGGVWRDEKYHQLGKDLTEAARGIERYLGTADDHEAHLAQLIRRLEEYLRA